jgi:hypothetical protein
MSDLLFWVSCLGVLVFGAYWAVSQRKVQPLLLSLGFLGAFVPFLIADRVVFPPWASKVLARGEDHQGLIIFLLYFAMLAGMLAHFAYSHLSLPRKRRRGFDVANFLAPVLVSPIVFLPLAAIFENSESAAASSSHLMLLLVAFENGFFWREFFENRQKSISTGGDK